MSTTNRGKFITFEGGDGAGKSTHITRLAAYLEKKGKNVLIIREPGGTKIGEKIRELLLDKNNAEMVPQAELLLYEASRAQLVAEKIQPALDKGCYVLADRFYDSSVAYQGYARGLNIEYIHSINMFATDHLVPDKTIILAPESVSVGLEQARMCGEADRIESAGTEFHEKVWKGFLHIAKIDPERFSIIKLQETQAETFNLILDSLKGII